jgi:hypothetical protein
MAGSVYGALVTLGAVVVRSPFEGFTVWVRRGGPRPDGEQLELARWAATQFRLGIDMGDPGVAGAARELVRLLDGDGSAFSGLLGLEDSVGPPRPPNALSPFGNAFGGIAARLEEELLAGRLVVERQRVSSLTERRGVFEPELPPLPPPRRESTTRTFEVRFLDEVGKAISGIDAEFTADGAQTRPTNAAGIALLEGVQSSKAHVAILDPEALSKVLDPRWESFRPGTPPKEANTTEVVFRGGSLGPFPLKGELPNTVVIKPPLGKLFVELWDKTGRVRHANRAYQIMGPQSFEGTTDSDGRLLHESVFPGDYQLSLALELSEDGVERFIDIIDEALVVLAPSAAAPQVRFVGAARRVTMARLRGMFFETNKSFLLPGAAGAFALVRELYDDNNPSQLLIVGHTDTTAEPTINDPLSLERADMTAAYLFDDEDAWLGRYDAGVPAKRRWGTHEDELMLSAMRDFGTKPEAEEPVRWFQRTRGLTVDGQAGPRTRRQLIHEYMALDGTSLRERPRFDLSVTTHGCSENFPLDDGQEELDAAPADAKEDASDRRVELFFFDAEFGIQPPPPGKVSPKGSTQYPEWRKKVTNRIELQSSFLEGLVVEWAAELDDFVPPDLVLQASQDGKTQRLPWTDGFIDGPFRRFIFRKILGSTPVTLLAQSEELAVELTLWRDQVVSDPDVPPTWERRLEELLLEQFEKPDDDELPTEVAAAVPAISDEDVRPAADIFI